MQKETHFLIAVLTGIVIFLFYFMGFTEKVSFTHLRPIISTNFTDLDKQINNLETHLKYKGEIGK